MSTPRTVLLATFGSLGDLHPFIAVGIALRSRGVRVRIATSADYRSAVEAAGLEFASMRPALETLGDPEVVARRLFDPMRGSERLLREIVMPRLSQQYDDLLRASEGADLLVSHTLTYTLPVIAVETRRPWLSAVLAPIGLFSAEDPPSLPGIDLLRLARRWGPWTQRLATGAMRLAIRRLETPLRNFRAAHGIVDDDRTVFTLEGQHSPYGTLALFDAPLATPQPDWPSRLEFCGAALHDGALPDALVLGELQRFLDQGEAPIVFALGSAAVHIARDFWREAIAATLAVKRRAILLTGKPIADELPEGIRAFDYLPYSRVFPQAAAIVHQVGIGTLSLALRAGHPQLLLPVGMDQPDNARRAASLGVGRVLPFQRANRRTLTRELSALLDDAGATAKAKQLAARLRPVDGASTAAERIIARL
ncbi:MAG: nucleotide disphospho-sugar-binding domain-containing protein [Steroidobacteraceae bacterium]